MKLAYADPPYLGQGAKWYGKHHPEAAVWDDPQAHANLVARLVDEYPDGWALSLSTPSLALYLRHCPDDVRVAAWCKTWHQFLPLTTQYAWEPVIWRGGRKDPKRKPWVRDWMACSGGNPAHGPHLPGAKPQEFNRWVLDLLAFDPEFDTLDDLFPGSGGMAQTLAAPTLDLTGGVA